MKLHSIFTTEQYISRILRELYVYHKLSTQTSTIYILQNQTWTPLQIHLYGKDQITPTFQTLWTQQSNPRYTITTKIKQCPHNFTYPKTSTFVHCFHCLPSNWNAYPQSPRSDPSARKWLFMNTLCSFRFSELSDQIFDTDACNNIGMWSDPCWGRSIYCIIEL